ncbi:hypothetical protein [Sagittula sp. SSi028]|uniref:hypothetical protein n=1 Tax=Sagittula sp. SSi028 TaxID=3400636 RepID=UPI003AF7DE83
MAEPTHHTTTTHRETRGNSGLAFIVGVLVVVVAVLAFFMFGGTVDTGAAGSDSDINVTIQDDGGDTAPADDAQNAPVADAPAADE